MIEYMSVLLEEISDQSELFDADFAILGDDFLVCRGYFNSKIRKTF